jgi:hypothetical protein
VPVRGVFQVAGSDLVGEGVRGPLAVGGWLDRRPGPGQLGAVGLAARVEVLPPGVARPEVEVTHDAHLGGGQAGGAIHPGRTAQGGGLKPQLLGSW